MRLVCCVVVKGRQKRRGRHPRQCCAPRLAPKRQSRKPIFRLAQTIECTTAVSKQKLRERLTDNCLRRNAACTTCSRKLLVVC